MQVDGYGRHTLPHDEPEIDMVDVVPNMAEARPLNVTDALSYLDDVKTQFMDQPEVYNNFLDIMKDFKSQSIDTPGVIERVSNLFRGHNDLIQGFNTFLPPGYRIVCTGNSTATTITVTTPAGTMTQSTNNHGFHLHDPQVPPATIVSPMPYIGHPVAAGLQLDPHGQLGGSPVPFGTSSAVTTLGGMSSSGGASDRRQGPAPAQEFHNAIQYVNKIKTRFDEDPDTYKLFLDILHSYRNNQNHDDVYSQVQALFKDAPDLLAEFKNFLPTDGSGLAFSSEAVQDQSWQDDRRDVPTKRKKKAAEPPVAVNMYPGAPVVNTKSASVRTKKPKHKEGGVPESYNPYSRPVSPNHQAHGQPMQGQGGSSSHAMGSGGLGGLSINNTHDELTFFDRAKKALESREMYDDFLKMLNMFSREIIDARTLITRAQTFLGDTELYAQFKDLMGWDGRKDGDDMPPGSIRSWAALSKETDERFGKSYRRLPLAETTLACSGRDELCRSVLNDVWVSHPTWASEESGFVSHKKNSYEEALHKSEEERHEFQFFIDIITRTIALLEPIHARIMDMTPEERNAFRLPPDFGGSSKSIYHRAIKKVYGRDSQGLEVLQALQDCPAIAIPVVLPRLKQKNEEWRRAQRDWNKVWREVDGRNFYKSLDHQGISFKANDKKGITNKSLVTEIESAKAEVVAAAAQAKKKASAYKGNVEERLDAYDLALAPHLDFEFKDLGVLQDALKLTFSFLDRSSNQYTSHERRSVERMLRAFVPLFCGLPLAEFDAVFGPPIEADTTDNEDAVHDDTAMSDDGDEPKSGTRSGGTTSASGRRSAGGSNHGLGGIHPNDLRKKLLKTAQEKAVKARSGSASVSRAVSPSPSDDEHVKSEQPPSLASAMSRKREKRDRDMQGGSGAECEEWAKLMPMRLDFVAEGEKEGMSVDAEETAFEKLAKHGIVEDMPFYTNTTYYSLIRLLQLLYSRLLHCKLTAERLVATPKAKSHFTVNAVAEQLGLVDAHGPGAVLALAASVSVPSHSTYGDNGHVPFGNGMNGSGLGANGVEEESAATARPENHFYGYMLTACEKLFEQELDQNTFEENMRFLFGTKAYIVFTLDKLIAALIKQVQTAVMDPKCVELLALLHKVRTKGASTVREAIAYRREAEQYLGQDDHLYRIEWDRAERVLRVWLLGSADPSVDVRWPQSRGQKAKGPSGVGSCSADTEDPSSSASASTRLRLAARWRSYAESYVLTHATELGPASAPNAPNAKSGGIKGIEKKGLRVQVRRPFLLRTRREEEEKEEEDIGEEGKEGKGGVGAVGSRWEREGLSYLYPFAFTPSSDAKSASDSPMAWPTHTPLSPFFHHHLPPTTPADSSQCSSASSKSNKYNRVRRLTFATFATLFLPHPVSVSAAHAEEKEEDGRIVSRCVERGEEGEQVLADWEALSDIPDFLCPSLRAYSNSHAPTATAKPTHATPTRTLHPSVSFPTPTQASASRREGLVASLTTAPSTRSSPQSTTAAAENPTGARQRQQPVSQQPRQRKNKRGQSESPTAQAQEPAQRSPDPSTWIRPTRTRRSNREKRATSFCTTSSTSSTTASSRSTQTRAKRKRRSSAPAPGVSRLLAGSEPKTKAVEGFSPDPDPSSPHSLASQSPFAFDTHPPHLNSNSDSGQRENQHLANTASASESSSYSHSHSPTRTLFGSSVPLSAPVFKSGGPVAFGRSTISTTSTISTALANYSQPPEQLQFVGRQPEQSYSRFYRRQASDENGGSTEYSNYELKDGQTSSTVISFSSTTTSSTTFTTTASATTSATTEEEEASDDSDISLYTSRTIPDRYELGSDGLWHKVCYWSSCSSCSSESYSTADGSDSDVDNDDDDTSESDLAASGSVPSTSTSTSDDADDISSYSSSLLGTTSTSSSTYSASSSSSAIAADELDTADLTLPDGWLSAGSKGKNYKEPIIIVSSIILAILIGFAVWGAVCWKQRRKEWRRRGKREDVERKLGGGGKEGEESSSEDEGDGGGDAVAVAVRSATESRREMRGGDTSSVTLADGQAQEKKGRKFSKAAIEFWKTRARVTWMQKKKKGRRRKQGAQEASDVGVVEDAAAAMALANASGVEVHPSPTVSQRRRRSVESSRSSIASSSASSALAMRRSTAATDQASSSNAPTSLTVIPMPPPPALFLTDISPSTSHTHSHSESHTLPAPSESTRDEDEEPPIPTVQSPAYEERDIFASACPPAYRSHTHSHSVPLASRSTRRRNRRRSERGSESGMRSRGRERRTIDAGDMGFVARTREKGGYVGEEGDYVFDSDEGEIVGAVARGAGGEEMQEEEEYGDGESEGEMDERQRRGRDSGQMQLHVATDDKHALARLAERASAPTLDSLQQRTSQPPRILPSHTSQHCLVPAEGPSAPEPEALELDITQDISLLRGDEDEDEDDVGCLDSPGAGPGPSSSHYSMPRSRNQPGARHALPSLPLPLPPSHATHHTYDMSDLLEGREGEVRDVGCSYRFSYPFPLPSPPPAFSSSVSPGEDAGVGMGVGVGVVAGPSAPPELPSAPSAPWAPPASLVPSAPAFDEDDLQASAPPLGEYDEYEYDYGYRDVDLDGNGGSGRAVPSLNVISEDGSGPFDNDNDVVHTSGLSTSEGDVGAVR